MKKLIGKWYTRQLHDILSKPTAGKINWDKVTHCLNKGANPNVADGKLLTQAVYANNTAILMLALNKGANQSAGNYEALNWALFNGRVGQVEALLNHDKNAFQHIKIASYESVCMLAKHGTNSTVTKAFLETQALVRKYSANILEDDTLNFKVKKDLEAVDKKDLSIDFQKIKALENFVLQQTQPQKPVKSCCQKNSI